MIISCFNPDVLLLQTHLLSVNRVGYKREKQKFLRFLFLISFVFQLLVCMCFKINLPICLPTVTGARTTFLSTHVRFVVCFVFGFFVFKFKISEIWSYSGYAPMYAKYGNAYSWSMCARAQIYRRDQHNVQTVQDLQKIQRYNKWQVDSLSLGDSCRGISARCDLNSPATNNTLNGYSAFGAIDGKGEEKKHTKKEKNFFYKQTNVFSH